MTGHKVPALVIAHILPIHFGQGGGNTFKKLVGGFVGNDINLLFEIRTFFATVINGRRAGSYCRNTCGGNYRFFNSFYNNPSFQSFFN